MKSRTGKITALLSVLGVVVLIVAACGGDDATATPRPTARPTATSPPAATPTPAPTATPAGPQPVRGGTFNFWMTRNPTTMDINRARSSANWMTVLPQMNWLVQNFQSRKGPGPDLASSWSVSDDGKTWTFNMVQNALWHDGQQVTADDIAWTFTRITKNPDEQGVEGQGPVRQPPYLGSLSLITGIETPDDFTVVMTLSQVTAAFLPIIGAIGNVIYPQHVPISEFEQKRPVGSGPFVWGVWKADDSVTFTGNPNYFKKDAAGRQLPYMDGIKIFIIQDTGLGMAAFRTGKIDMTFPFAAVITVGVEEQIKNDLPGTQFFKGGMSWAYLSFRSGKAPFDNPNVRKAFSLAYDRRGFIDAYNEGRGSPFVFLTPVGSNWSLPEGEIRSLPGYNPDTKAADIAEAKRLLDEAGVTGDDLTVTIPVRDIYETIGVIAIDNLNRTLGIKLSLRLIDSATTLQVQNDGAFDIYVSRNSGFLDDPSALIDPFVRSGGGLNYGKWNDPDVDATLDAIDRELDVMKRLQLTNDLERKLIDLAWYVILGNTLTPMAWRGYVKNFDFLLHALDGPPWRFEEIWLER